MLEQVESSLSRLAEYCENEHFKGFDPYDGLNSKLFKSIPFVSKNYFAKLAWIQLFKKSPINFRRIAGVIKEYNPKALGLFLSAYCMLHRIKPNQSNLDKIQFFSDQLFVLQNNDWSGACWGYNFDWQARAFFQPRNTPTVVATSFVANALLDAYEITQDEKLLCTARSACDFVLKDLNRSFDDNNDFSFSYSPLDKSVVFNASLLGVRLLSRVYSFTKERELILEAKKSVNFCCNHQRPDGSWGYGKLPFHQWVDSFHTAYNLECINDYMKFSQDGTFRKHLNVGFEYYINTFFTEEGIPKYYNNSIYPIDIHAPAQLVITLSKLNKFNQYKSLLDCVLQWTINNMRSDKGYFYYQINKYFSSKVPYMRWAQAWMFYALATYNYEESK